MRCSVIAVILALGIGGLYFIDILYEEANDDSLNHFTMNESSKGKNDGAKMDWMYRDSSQIVDKEEYLLGRKVDKQFERNMLPNDKDRDCLPSSIFSKTAESQVDAARKLQEDPLYLIKKKEIESREQLLKNPRKMKQLQEMVARQQEAAKKLMKKEIKRKKKMQLDSLLVKKCKLLFGSVDIKKLKALSSASESSSDEDKKYNKKDNKSLDEVIAAKYKKLLGNLDAKQLEEMGSSSDSDKGLRSDGQRRRSRSSSSDYTKNKSRCKDKKSYHSNRHTNTGKERPEMKSRKKRESPDKSSSDNENVQDKEKLSLKGKRHESKMYSSDRDRHHSKYKSHSSNSKPNNYGRRKSSSESSDSSDNSCTSNKKLTKRKGKYNQYSVESKTCPPDNENKNHRVKKEKERKKYRSSSSNTESSSEDSESKKKGKRKQYGLVLPANYVPKKKPKEDDKPKVKEEPLKPLNKGPKRKLTEQEKELRLKEMMSNAEWREELREKSIKSHNEKLKSEKDDYVYNEDFMRKQMALAVSQGTVESRVKANINSIQRSGSSMNEHFARRH